MISGGCIISGSTVRHSVLFSKVQIHSYSIIQDCVILPDVTVNRNCRLTKVVFDKGCIVAEGTVIGEDPIADAEKYEVSPEGVVLVTPEMLGQQYRHVR